MYFVKALLAAIVFCICFGSAAGQAADEVLARVAGRDITAKDLSDEGQQIYAGKAAFIADNRKHLLDGLVTNMLLDAEAAAVGSRPEKLVGGIRAKIPEPSEAEIKAVYESARESLGGRSLDEVRRDIVRHIKREAEQKALGSYLDSLEKKHKVVYGKTIDAALKPADVVVTVGTKSVTAREFDERFKIQLYEADAEIADHLIHAIEDALYKVMLETESEARKIDAGSLLAAEITNKMRDFSPDEYEALNQAFRQTLEKKYTPKVLYKIPEPVVQTISVDDDPMTGRTDAPVTVVMFSDFQCPACAAAHPVITSTIAEFGDKIRFVVRDFPLESLHDHALEAALAANAANKQGKYREYSELLYSNQAELNTAAFKRFAAELGLNAKQFELDLTDEKAVDEIRKDVADGNRYGVSSTPTIFVNGVKIRQLSVAAFREAIEKALSK